MTETQGRKIAKDSGYSDYKMLSNGIDACIAPFAFTCAIISELSHFGYGDRWCYKNYQLAKAALDAWDGTGEPDGWHRHPDSGRRRENGKEYINF